MGICAILPVKPLRRGKSRLAGFLSDSDRMALNHWLLEHTLEVLSGVDAIDQLLVISRDPQVLGVARRFKSRSIMENSTSNLNRSLEIAAAMVRQRSHRGILIVPADLPLLTSEDIKALVERAAHPPVVVIAPDRHGTGTNGLLVSPPGLVPFTFGPQSFKRHSEAAAKAGARLEIVHTDSLALDLDLPEDLDLLRTIHGLVYESGSIKFTPSQPLAQNLKGDFHVQPQ